MRLPLWLVVTLLTTSALAVLFCGACWWVTWPERTAREFVALMRAGNLDEANKMLIAEGSFEFFYHVFDHKEEAFKEWRQEDLKATTRSLVDVVLRRERFIRITEPFNDDLVVDWDKVAVGLTSDYVSSEGHWRITTFYQPESGRSQN